LEVDIIETKTKFADEKLAEELLSDDELDNVAGGATQLSKEEAMLFIQNLTRIPPFGGG